MTGTELTIVLVAVIIGCRYRAGSSSLKHRGPRCLRRLGRLGSPHILVRVAEHVRAATSGLDRSRAA